MNITITARKFKAHDTLKRHILMMKLKSLNKFNDDILDADVILSYQNNKESIKIAEIIVTGSRTNITATEESDDFEKSVNSAIEKIVTTVKKIKKQKNCQSQMIKIDQKAISKKETYFGRFLL